MDNAELVAYMKLSAAGDQMAFRALAEALNQRIFTLAFRFLSGDRAMAEDITQDVLIKLWQYAPRWEAGGSVIGWVSRTTYNACMDIHRARKNKNDELPEDIREEETVSDVLLTKEYRRILLQAIKDLPERQQEAILLTYFHENSRRDVAATMKTTEKSVEHLVARGLRTLEKLIPANINGGKNALASRSV